jgi:Protein of unknown function (DUF2370)
MVCVADFISHCIALNIISTGDDVYLVPEESQKDTPPSYASAQADAVPPYWETTVHALSSPDDMIIDHLPTGSVFSFLWNLLISISFRFVGFLLTYRPAYNPRCALWLLCGARSYPHPIWLCPSGQNRGRHNRQWLVGHWQSVWQQGQGCAHQTNVCYERGSRRVLP